MKVLSIIPALLVGFSVVAPVSASPVLDVSRGDAYAIRACGDAYGRRNSVCYNRSRSATLTSEDGSASATRVVNRARRVRCNVPHPAGTERAALANEFCPQVRNGTLAPAPFLL